VSLRLCVFASTLEMDDIGFVVRVLTGSLDEICARAVEWGYDGIEFFPDPENIPDPAALERVASASGCLVPVIDTGRMLPQGMTLMDPDPAARERAILAFERMLELGAAVSGSVNMGGSRGNAPEGWSPQRVDALASDVFSRLAQTAERVGSRVLLEPTGDYTSYITTVAEATEWAERIDSPAFTTMLDTYQLSEAEASLESGIRAAKGRADHIHLYDPSRWPPGVLPEQDPAEGARGALHYLRGLGL
jgi:D-psicose/D-tagatose/L-ribulose 3-epimerase